MDERQLVEKKIEEINSKLTKTRTTTLLCQRARLFEKLQELGKALNDYTEILEAEPENTKARAKAEQVQTLLAHQKLDIFSDTNLHKDPWE
jgi:hypothetical protein